MSGAFVWRQIESRPVIELRVQRCQRSAWALFARHHYLDTSIHRSAVCFVAFWKRRPVAFSSWLNLPSGTLSNARREHRTVCLPDYQGVGIGNALSAYCASLWRGLGNRIFSVTGHPGMIRARARSNVWRMHREPKLGNVDRGEVRGHATSRITAGFEYVGPAMPAAEANRLLNSWASGQIPGRTADHKKIRRAGEARR